MTNPAISFAIPFYKGEAYLHEAIASVHAQTRTDWELIVIDDGPDPSIGARAVFHGDPRVRYLRNERNLGMAGNWNKCLHEATAPLVTLLHNDDRLLPNYAETMVVAAAEHPTATALYCRATIIDHAGQPSFSLVDFAKTFLQPKGKTIVAGPEGVARLIRGNFIICPTVCYRKSLLPDPPFNARWKMVLDLEFYLRVLIAGGTIVGLPIEAYAYRRHDENATSTYTRDRSRFDEEDRLHQAVYEWARDNGYPDAARVARRRLMLQCHVLFRILQDTLRADLSNALRKWDVLWRLVLRSFAHVG